MNPISWKPTFERSKSMQNNALNKAIMYIQLTKKNEGKKLMFGGFSGILLVFYKKWTTNNILTIH